jgi:hypothetical protein
MTEPREPGADDPLLERVRRLPRDIEPPGDLWHDVAADLGAGAAPRPVPGPHRAWGFAPHSRFASWRVRPALAAALVAALGAALWLHVRSAPAWRVAFTAGRPTLASGAITTDSASAARIAVAGGRLGQVDVEPHSHVRLLVAARLEQRLALDVGTIRARISAPPRIFTVETPSATAVDLGCAYTLAVDRHGTSLIHVTLGWVELDRPNGTSVVPFNMSAYTRPGFAPGTPFADRADAALKAALYRFDFEQGGDGALAVVLERANTSDAITLWHLLRRTSGAARALVYLRLAALAPPPAGVTQEGVLQLRPRDLQTWWDALPGSPGTLPRWQRLALRISAWLGVL